jgi:hypothetical protein
VEKEKDSAATKLSVREWILVTAAVTGVLTGVGKQILPGANSATWATQQEVAALQNSVASLAKQESDDEHTVLENQKQVWKLWNQIQVMQEREREVRHKLGLYEYDAGAREK